MTSAKRRIAFLSHHQDPQFLSVLDKAAFDWLSLQNDWQIELVSFSDAGKLKEFDGACWYYSESSELPAAAVDAAEKVRDYVKSGGKLLLALIAAKYVDTLGIDNAPDAVEWKEESFFYWNGYVALEPHPVFENLPRGFFVADNAVLKPFVNARWLESPPKNGRVLGIANWGARFVEDERVIVEWDLGAGQVIAFGMHNFRFDTEPSENFVTLVRNAFNYISAPFVAKLSIVSDNPAVPKGAGYLGSHYKDSVVISEGSSIRAAITGKAWKALDITLTARTPAGGVVSTTSFIPGQQFTVELPLGTNDLSPGEYVAGVDIAQGDETLTSLSREFFIVPETAQSGPADRHWMWELRTPNLVAEIDKGTGTVWGLYDSSSNTKVQFAGNPDNLPAVATPDHRWLGDLVLKYRFNGDITWRSMTTANSSEIRRVLGQEDSVVVVYDPGPPEQLGATEPMISERFTVEGDSLNWKIRIKNRSQAGMVLGELAMPLALNTCFAGETDMSEIYERRVMLHSFIGGASSWILAAPLAGIPPYLLIWAKEGTKLEAIAHVDEYGQRPDGWEGLINVFPYSKASRETRNWYEWYNNHSQAVILPGEELVLNFGIKFIQDYKEINETLFADGKVAVDVAPAMVLPTDMTGHLRVSSKKQFSVTGDDYTTIEKVSSDGTSSVYRFKFGRTGQHNLTITDVDGEVTNLHFLAIEPIEKLAKAHAIHIARDQQYRDPKSFRDGQFFMYDAEEERMVMKPRHGHMSGGSDECGLAEPLSLVWKNVVDPNPDEIETMEYYIERFLYGKVQQKETYAVSTGVGDSYDDEQAYNRSFNYPHVVNIYFAMSKIAEYYGLTRFRDSDGYLLMAYRTAIAYFTLPMYKNNALACGNFGESLYFDLMNTLRAKGYTDEADELQVHLQRKADHFLPQPHPYLSEYAFDTTGYSDAYYFKKFGGGIDGAIPVVSMLRATRGRQPSWPWFGGDVRWGWGASKYPYHDELCMNYMVPQNGRCLLDFYHETGEIDDLRIGYGSFTANWCLVRPDGVARNLYTWEPQRMTYDPWTSEMGTGLYFTYLMACSYAVDDPAFGLVGYGCDVEGSIDGHISVIPHDGVQRRVRIAPFSLFIESHAVKINRVDAEDGGKKLSLLLRETLGKDNEDKLIVRGLPEGSYTLSANYTDIGTFTSDECAAGIRVPVTAGAAIPVHLVRIK